MEKRRRRGHVHAAWVILLAVAAPPLRADPGSCKDYHWLGSYDSDPARAPTVGDCEEIPQEALLYTQRCMEQFKGGLVSTEHVVFCDFSTDGNLVRCHVLKWDQEYPGNSHEMLRGGGAFGSGNNPPTPTMPATASSNRDKSNATPGGCMRLFGNGEAQTMQSVGLTLQAYRLDGLEARNACTYQRGIDFHESYLVHDRNLVKTSRRGERFQVAGPEAIPIDRYLCTGVSGGCIVVSHEDFEVIKSLGIVPAPGAYWKPTMRPRQREGILFVAWFWGNDSHNIVARDSKVSCGSEFDEPAVAKPDGLDEILYRLRVDKHNAWCASNSATAACRSPR